MRRLAVVILCAALLTAGTGCSRAVPAARLAAAPRIGQDLPTLSPAPVNWGLEGRYPEFQPLTDVQRLVLKNLSLDPDVVEGRQGREAAVQAQLRAVQAELTGPNGVPPYAGLRSGAGQLILRLSPPSGLPRAIVLLREGRLIELSQKPDSTWNARPLTEFRPSMIGTFDLTGEGRPEIIAARLDGSGAFLTLQILTWDDRRVRELFRSTGAMEPGQFGFFDAEGDGRSELYIDTAAGHGLFRPGTHGPYLRDRLVYRFDGQTYVLSARFRFATPFYHLNRYLYFACRGDWKRASQHAESGARVDRRLAAWLGEGGLAGAEDAPFVNGRMGFQKMKINFRAEFGPTGRLLSVHSAPEGGWPAPKGCGS